MQSITEIVLDELGAALQFARGALATSGRTVLKPSHSFLELPAQVLVICKPHVPGAFCAKLFKQANVRIASSANAFPTVRSLVEVRLCEVSLTCLAEYHRVV